jgi:hypothetical protein
MALVKFIRIFSVVSLAILHTSLDALPVNALIVERGHVGRDFSHAHAEIAKKRGDSSKKCRPRPSNAPQSAVATTTYHTTTTIPNNAPSSNPSEPAHTTSSSQSAPTNAPASSVNSKVMYAWSNNEQPSISNFLPGSGQTRLCVHLLVVSGFPPLTSLPRIYNWHLSTYSDIDVNTVKNLEFVPTAHSPSDVYQIPSVLKKGYAKYVKFLNE